MDGSREGKEEKRQGKRSDGSGRRVRCGAGFHCATTIRRRASTGNKAGLHELCDNLHVLRMAVSRPREDEEVSLPLAEWASLQTFLVWAHQGSVEPQWRHGRIFSPHQAAWLLRRGRVTVNFGGRNWEAREGQWLFPPEGDRLQHFSDDAEVLSIRFKAAWPTGESLIAEGQGLVLSESEAPELTQAADDLVRFTTKHLKNYISWDVMQCMAPLSQSLELQALFSRWLHVAMSALAARGITLNSIGRMDQRVLKIVRHLDRHSWTQPVKESDLAQRVGLSVSQLNRLFMRQFGISPHGYFDRRRYQSALSALTESSQPIKEISYRLGFSSMQHFSTWFNRRHGVPPRLLRMSAKTQLEAAKPEAPRVTKAKPASAKTTRAPRSGSKRTRRRRPSG